MRLIVRLLVIAILILHIATGQSIAQCPDYLSLNTQQDVDDFPINYPNCTEIDGFVHLYGEDISNLNGLQSLTSIGGYVSINWTSLTDLSGLDNLISIGGYLVIVQNDLLTNLTGL